MFRRQRTIVDYILDFYCPDFGLVIEIDGSQHAELENVEADELRTAYLVAHGLRVLRFTNSQVLEDMSGVLQTIVKAMTRE